MRILLTDPHPAIHAALTALFTDTGAVLVGAHAGGRALELFTRDRPDLMIVELALPDMPGLEVVTQTLDKFPTARIVAYAADDCAETVAQAMKNGLIGFVGKSDPLDALVTCVSRATQGQSWMPERLQQDVALMRIKGGTAVERFSRRELKVLRALSHGASLTEIAHDHAISYKTVTNEVAQLRQKLGARTQPEMIRVAMEKRLIF